MWLPFSLSQSMRLLPAFWLALREPRSKIGKNLKTCDNQTHGLAGPQKPAGLV
jgi:hypothetical protein